MIRKLKATFNRIFRRKEIEAALEHLEYTPGQLSAVYKYPAVTILAAEIGGLFDESGGINHVEFSMFDASSMRRFKVTIQYDGRPTPIQANQKMRAALTEIATGRPEEAYRIAAICLNELGYVPSE